MILRPCPAQSPAVKNLRNC